MCLSCYSFICIAQNKFPLVGQIKYHRHYFYMGTTTIKHSWVILTRKLWLKSVKSKVPDLESTFLEATSFWPMRVLLTVPVPVRRCVCCRGVGWCMGRGLAQVWANRVSNEPERKLALNGSTMQLWPPPNLHTHTDIHFSAHTHNGQQKSGAENIHLDAHSSTRLCHDTHVSRTVHKRDH